MTLHPAPEGCQSYQQSQRIYLVGKMCLQIVASDKSFILQRQCTPTHKSLLVHISQLTHSVRHG